MGSASTPRTSKRWVIQVVDAAGRISYLRHGPKSGGSIVRFTSKLTAEINVEFVRDGLNAGTVVHVIDAKDVDEGCDG